MITIKRESDLETQTWVFQHVARAPLLLRWELSTRPSTRHKFRPSRTWWHGYCEAAPLVPTDVLDEARRQFIETLKVEP